MSYGYLEVYAYSECHSIAVPHDALPFCSSINSLDDLVLLRVKMSKPFAKLLIRPYARNCGFFALFSTLVVGPFSSESDVEVM